MNADSGATLINYFGTPTLGTVLKIAFLKNNCKTEAKVQTGEDFVSLLLSFAYDR